MINVFASSRYKVNRKTIKSKTVEILQLMKIDENSGLNIVFVGKNKMKNLALTYKKENVALPVLSFQYQSSNTGSQGLLGEIIVCYPQAVLLAAERNRKVEATIMGLIEHAINNLVK